MSWTALLALAAGTYAMKAFGPLVLGERRLPSRCEDALALVPVPLFAGLVLVQTVTVGETFAIDARLPAVAVAAFAIWRRAPFLVVVLLAAGTSALLHALA